MQRGRSSVSVAELVDAGLLRPGQELRYRRDAQVRGHLTADGKITLDGRDFSSPSAAARAAAGGMSTNGWKAWCVELDGEQVDLAQLRSQFLTAR